VAFQSKPLSDDFSVSAQIMPEEIEAIKKAGFKSVINNRPDGEKPNQPLSASLSEIFTTNGLEVCNIPMSPGQLSPQMVSEMAKALSEMPKPILAFCASGTRSSILWCCANVQDLGVDEVLSAATKAGYDLEQIRPLLNQLSQ
jgi:sulfide:quinone oxidoreductase